MEIPVYLINGFLDSGKTTFIQDTISDPGFLDGEKTLLITCEEGECEYDAQELLKQGVILETVEEEEDFTPEYLQSCREKYMPQKVILEYNGMWRMEKIYGMKLPENWEIVQVITTVDASTFSLYLNNMRSLVMEQFQDTDMVIFNRCDENTPLASYRRSVKAVNPGAQVYMENADGSQPSDEDILPYDMSTDTIELEDTDFGIWYMDVMGAPEKYDGKTIHMRAQVYKNMKLPSNAFVPGRFVMTCCEDDIRFVGPMCVATPAIEPKVKRLKKRDWIYLTAKIKLEYAPLYKGEGPVLYAEKIEPAQKAAEEFVYFN